MVENIIFVNLLDILFVLLSVVVLCDVSAHKKNTTKYLLNSLIDQAKNQNQAQHALNKLQTFKTELMKKMKEDGIKNNKLQNNKHIAFINATRFAPGNNGFTTKTATQETLDTVKDALKEYLALTKDTLTFVVFDEMFWSQEKPLKDTSQNIKEITKDTIDKMIKDISSKNPNVFFVVNYLYESDIEDGDEEKFREYLRSNHNSFAIQSITDQIARNFINNDKIFFSQTDQNSNPLYVQSLFVTNKDMMNNFIYSIKTMIKFCIIECLIHTSLELTNINNLFTYNNQRYVADKTIQEAYKLMQKYASTICTRAHTNNAKLQKLQNQTLVIHNSNELVQHNKHGYFNEYNNGIIARSHIYVPGDGYNQDGKDFNNEHEIAKYIRDNLGIEICLDLNLGKNKINFFKASEHSVDTEKVLIVQSNHIEILDDHNLGNLPEDIIISHSDKDLLKSIYNNRYNSVKYSAGFNFLQYKCNSIISKLLCTTVGDTYTCNNNCDYVNITLEVINT